MISSRAFVSGLLLVLPLWGVLVGWALDNGVLILVSFIAFLVALWGLDLTTRARDARDSRIRLGQKNAAAVRKHPAARPTKEKLRG